MTTEWTSKKPCNRTTLSERCKECPLYYKPSLCPADRGDMKGVPKMLEQQILKLYELKGHLEARSDILDSSILFTQRLQASLKTDNYNGYARGKVELYREWQRYTEMLLGMVEQIIEELENARQETPTP